MKIGIYNTTPVIHGGSTLALNWWRSFKLAGFDTKIFAMSKSGKKLSGWRKDIECDVLSIRDGDAAREYVKQFDVVIPLAGFLHDVYDKVLKPEGSKDILASAKAIFMYHGRGILDNREIETRGYMGMIYDLPNVVGIGVGGQVVQDSFMGDPEISKLVGHLPFYIMRHPAFLPYDKPTLSPGRGLLSVARFIPSKKIPKLLSVVKEHEDFFGKDFLFELWGDSSVSREKYLVTQKFPEMMEKYYRGPYDSSTLMTVMSRGSYTIDLTDYVSGAQCCYFEALAHGVIPIVMRRWVLNDSAVPLDGREPTDIFGAASFAKEIPDAERLRLVSNGWDYMKEHHDPANGARKLASFIKELIN